MSEQRATAPVLARDRERSCILARCMSRVLRALLLVATLVLLTFSALDARAASSVAELAAQLRGSDDFRVRTQAALALGASGEESAVQPLCGALASDANPSVKVAAAAALGKLGKKSALPCLRSALGRETVASTKAQIEKSIAALDAPAAPPPPGADTRFYVAIQVTNKTGRPAAEVDAIVRAAMQDKLLAKKGYAVAPKSEAVAQGGQIVKSKKLKGFLLIATVEPPAYAGGDLTQVVRVSMWSYPDKALQGELAPRLTQSSTSKGDTQSETLLMKMCAETAVESFQKVAGTM